MKKNKGTDKVISAAGTILFVGLIQTSAQPPLVAIAGLTMALYEICLWVCRIARREALRERKRHYIDATRFDMERVAAQQFKWKMKEVR